MHEFKVIPGTFRATDGSDRMETWYTFVVSDDGGKTWVPSFKWARECGVEGMAKTFYIDRVIDRLKMGRSSEAFGGHQVLVDGRPSVKLGKANGRGRVFQEEGEAEFVIVGAKRREVRRPWRFSADGRDSDKTFPTEEAARAACAIHCFMTRGKAGRIQHAADKLKEMFPESECLVWACAKDHEVKASVDGRRVAIGWLPPEKSESRQWEVEKFKPLEDVPVSIPFEQRKS